MLPEVGGLEYVVIAVVALIVVGPKDLPVMLRKVGQFVGKLRGMAAEFRASFDEMARQSELDDLRKEVEAMRRGQLLDQAAHEATSVEVSQIFNEIGDSLNNAGVTFHPGQASQSLAQTAEIETPEPSMAEPTVVEAKPRARRKPAEPTVAEAKKPRAKAAPKTVKAAAAKTAAPKKVAAPKAPAAKAPAKRAAKARTGTVA
jgi:sec-independent protein translocase protein TatB